MLRKERPQWRGRSNRYDKESAIAMTRKVRPLLASTDYIPSTVACERSHIRPDPDRHVHLLTSSLFVPSSTHDP
jgi:hypothetical protein